MNTIIIVAILVLIATLLQTFFEDSNQASVYVGCLSIMFLGAFAKRWQKIVYSISLFLAMFLTFLTMINYFNVVDMVWWKGLLAMVVCLLSVILPVMAIFVLRIVFLVVEICYCLISAEIKNGINLYQHRRKMKKHKKR